MPRGEDRGARHVGQALYARTASGPEGLARGSKSLLTEIGTVTADGTAHLVLRFEYTAPWNALKCFDLTDGQGRNPTAEGRTWVDVDGDALPGPLKSQPSAWRHRK